VLQIISVYVRSQHTMFFNHAVDMCNLMKKIIHHALSH